MTDIAADFSSNKYRIYGAELSPYSVKVRSYLRFKQIPHQWIIRSAETMEEFAKYAVLPIIPLVVSPQLKGAQDSTLVMEQLEALHPQDSIYPEDTTVNFVSTLLEEFGDEWGNKWMFHYRWARDIDQLASARRIAQLTQPDAKGDELDAITEQVRQRMTGRVWFVGSNPETAPQIEASLHLALEQLEVHLESRPYVLGGRPSFGDFSLWGQLYNVWTDPTNCALIEAKMPSVLAWIQRMLWPRIEGDFESWESLKPTLKPFIKAQIGELFLPWSQANAEAIAQGKDEFSVQLNGHTWTQKPQKYHAKSLQALREKYAALNSHQETNELLQKTGCLGALI
ncbi:glutathione S-transferase family protein [Porticoccaceae bacterium]|jgi:glutathione S-transferase|nr:glutathione S-transferase family protein [Porticoccaceae bacterium]